MTNVTPTVIDYLKRVQHICEHELMLDKDLANMLDITQATLIRIRRSPETCSMKTIRKIKKFVDQWESKNLIITH